MQILKQSNMRVQDPSTRFIYHLSIQEDVSPLESALLSFLLASRASMGGYNWWEYILRHKLERHFEREML